MNFVICDGEGFKLTDTEDEKRKNNKYPSN